MNPSDRLLRRLEQGPPLLLDGPSGTELERRGAATLGPLWSTAAVREQPDAVLAVHREYVVAGADILTTVTFRAHERAFRAAGLGPGEWTAALHEAVRLARTATDEASRPLWVAGSVAPLGDCYAPDEVPPDAALAEEHGKQGAAMGQLPVDLILVETMNTAREAVEAARAARTTGRPVVVSFLTVPGGLLLSGEPLREALSAIAPHADAVAVNCATLQSVDDAIPELRRVGLPWGAYANGSPVVPMNGWSPTGRIGVGAYVEAAQGWLDAGAAFIGSCCGTGPRYTRALRHLLDTRA